MKQVKVWIGMLALGFIVAGCGVNKISKISGDEMEIIELAKPENVTVSVENDEAVLSWNTVDNATEYVIYRGSSKFSDDYAEFGRVGIKENPVNIDKDYMYYRVAAANGMSLSELSDAASYENAVFGKNVYIYSTTDDPEKVNEEIHKIYLRQEAAQFGKGRYLIMFKPGEYSEAIKPEVGFYTEIIGLGELPTDTQLGSLDCKATWLGDSTNHNATCNFWRGVSNLSINSNVLWAVSQATFMRRMDIKGNLTLHDNYGWASGGFLADSVISGTVDSGSQQQWLTRNSSFSKWAGENWNIVFVGDEKKGVPDKTWPQAAYTGVEKTPVIKEKPYLIFKDNEYYVCHDSIRNESLSASWINNNEKNIIPLSEFYIAKAGVAGAEDINNAINQGKNILFTPGIYKLDKAVEVTQNDTIILGSGYATLVCQNDKGCMDIIGVEGVTLAGILFDAGKIKSEYLLKVGNDSSSNPANPILLSDVFFRVGGTTTDDTQTETCVIINSGNVIGDNFWVWRADHGDGVAWNKNTAEQGIIVNGNDVTIYALMVEHFKKYQTVWNGENGSVYFYQSELPYDVPKQDEWCSHEGNLHGYASYYVADDVSKHTAYGIGIYSYNRDAIVEEYCAMEIPDCEGMDIHNVCAVMITGYPGISHVINNLGKPCYKGGTRSIIIDFQEERNNNNN